MKKDSEMRLRLSATCLLAAFTVAVFLPVAGHEFLVFDDTFYVTRNPHVQAGLTWEGLLWAFRTGHSSNWHPLTWLSHMLDVQLFELNAGAHHLVNVLLHAVNAALLFLLLHRMTGGLWCSGVVAALFALHPLHVESVAWVAERKDVLSTFFGLLTIGVYARYAASRSSPPLRGSALNYGLALVFFALGLMSKPMLVTWPFVLLLLDFWPLRRLVWEDRSRRWRRLLALTVEKLPFFALTVASCVATFIAQKRGGSVAPLESFSFLDRVANGLVAYGRYLQKLFWPADLAILYPLQSQLPVEQVILAASLLVAITVLVVRLVRGRPWLGVGWLWFVGTLVPVIGLVHVGNQSMADRYTYIPYIGLFVAIVWTATDLLSTRPVGRLILGVAGATALAVCASLTSAQLRHWENSGTLFTHALRVTESNYVAYNNLGFYLADHGQSGRAIQLYEQALRINPAFHDGYNNLGCALADQKRYGEAVRQYETALRPKPTMAAAHNNLANALINLGRTNDATAHYLEALRIEPDYAQAHYNLANALLDAGQSEEAIVHYAEALRHDPTYAEAHNNWAFALTKQNKPEEALRHYRQALRINPDLTAARYGMAMLLADRGELNEAIIHYRTVLQRQPNHSGARVKLGVALATQGKLEEAMAQFGEALRKKPDDASAHYHLGLALDSQGRTREAITHYREALRFYPDYPDALNNLAWRLASHPDAGFRDGPEAVRLAARACELTEYKVPLMVGTLAAAFAEAGRFSEAVATAQKARALAEAAGEKELAAKNEELLRLYESGQPYHEMPEATNSAANDQP